MNNSVLEAVKNGDWDFEPEEVAPAEFDSTNSLPGSEDKVATMAERARSGLPLWHPSDRKSWDDSDEAWADS